MASPAKYDFPVTVRGDTIESRTITIQINSLPANISSARMQIRDSKNNTLIYTPTLVIGSGTITIPRIPAATTATMSGTYLYDIEVTLADGSVNTYLRGNIPVSVEDITR